MRVTIVSLDADDGQPLVNDNVDMTRLSLVTLSRLDEGILLQLLFDITDIDMVHLVADRIASCTLEQRLNLFLIQETLHGTIHDMDVHLTTDIVRLIRAVKCRDGQYKIDCQGEVDQYDCCLFPVDSHSSNDYLLAFSFSILAISGT